MLSSLHDAPRGIRRRDCAAGRARGGEFFGEFFNACLQMAKPPSAFMDFDVVLDGILEDWALAAVRA